MQPSLTDTVFMRILPVLLTAAIMWMMTSINTLQVQNVRMEQQLIENHNLLRSSSDSLEKVESKIITQQISITLLEQQLGVLRRDLELHINNSHKD